jgi:hypothetical protein
MATTLRCSSIGPLLALVDACTISSRAKIGCDPSPNNVLEYMLGWENIFSIKIAVNNGHACERIVSQNSSIDKSQSAIKHKFSKQYSIKTAHA